MRFNLRGSGHSGRRPSVWQCANIEQLESRVVFSAATVLTADEMIQLLAAPVTMNDAPPAQAMPAAMTSMNMSSGGMAAGSMSSGMSGGDMDMSHDGVTITPTQIITHTEVIPRFAANPTIVPVISGPWNNPRTWSSGRVPTDGDRVMIPEGFDIYYTSIRDEHIDAIEISGTLRFATQANTRLIVGTLTVMPAGTLTVGTAADPVKATLEAEIVIADKPLDFAHDPRQYGTGMIVLGKISMYGTPIASGWSGLALEARAGQTSLLVNSVANWRPGDTIVLPDSRQVYTSESELFAEGKVALQIEEATISRIVGNRVYLTAPLKYDHLGAYNTSGGVELMPDVAMLDRNVIVRSENPQGTRGHILIHGRADADIEYVRLDNLGRTDAMVPLDNSTFDAMGMTTHVGTNQVGRYAIHFHHVMGPVNPTNTGYQFKLVGSVVTSAKKWGVAVHDTSYGLVSNNVVYGAQGAGFVTEDGNEIGNEFLKNFALGVQGTNIDGKEGTAEKDFGRGGSGFWFRRDGNVVNGNVAADNSFAGFVFDSYNNTGMLALPNFRGADIMDPMQVTMTLNNPALSFADNTAYGMSTYGLWAAYIAGDNTLVGQPLVTISRLKLWNILSAGVIQYHTANVTYDGLLILGSKTGQNRNDTGTTGMQLRTYENRGLVIRNSRIEGVRYGIMAPKNDGSTAGVERPTIIENSVLRNYINLTVNPADDNRGSNGNSLIVRNVKFDMVTTLPTGPSPVSRIDKPANIRMQVWGAALDYTQRSVVRVYDFNQVKGDNFQVYYNEQVASYVLPQTRSTALTSFDEQTIGSPSAGFTNLQNWSNFGIALAGGLAPANATTRDGIVGLVGPIDTFANVTPRVVFVTPWEGAQLPGGLIGRIRYNLIGNLPAGAQLWFSIDNVIFDISKGVSINMLPPGNHTYRAWIGNSQGALWPATTVSVRNFKVLAT